MKTPPLIGDLAESAVRLAVAVVGCDRVQAILDAERSAAAEAVFGAAAENTTAKASPQAKKKGG